jgi:hypothetical protein
MSPRSFEKRKDLAQKLVSKILLLQLVPKIWWISTYFNLALKSVLKKKARVRIEAVLQHGSP